MSDIWELRVCYFQFKVMILTYLWLSPRGSVCVTARMAALRCGYQTRRNKGIAGAVASGSTPVA